jgi:alpha-D-ribose 1-methylphosphonate 5-triphosphate synthase subunit PhnH
VLRGLADPVADSQAIFRVVLDAMARPGSVVEVRPGLEAPASLGPAAAAVCLALVDFETPLWLDRAARTADTVEYLRFHCGAPIVDAPGDASFAVVTDVTGAPALGEFAQGTDEEPERSTTVIVQVAGLEPGEGCRLIGPGIAGETRLRAAGLTPAFWSQARDNHGAFPRGVDLLLVAGARLVALPRTTRVEA